MRMLSADTGSSAVGAAKDDGARHGPAGHVVRLGRRVDNVIDSLGQSAYLHGEVEGHEFTNGFQAGEPGPNGDAGKAHFGDGRVDDPLGAEAVEQALGDLVRAVVLGHFLSQQEHTGVARHLLANGGVKRVAHGQGECGGRVAATGQTGDADHGRRSI